MIKGISDIRRFPRAGKIHLGERRISDKTGREYPAAVDYFVLPEDRPDLRERYGDKPRMLPIMFPVDDIEVVAPQWYKRYGSGSGLVCRGDGEVALCRQEVADPATGEIRAGDLVEVECPGQDCEWYQKGHCRHVMNLMFLLPDFISDGVWQLDTSSYHSIVNINGAWDYIRSLTGGRIAMLPLVLRVVPKEVSPGGRKKVVHVLDLRLAGRYSLDELRALAARPLAPAALPEPDCSTEPEYFYPPEVRPAPQPAPEPQEPHDELPEIDDPVVDDLAAQMAGRSDNGIQADIEALMDELGMTQAQRTLARHRHPDPEDLINHLLERRNNGGNAGRRANISPIKSSNPSEARAIAVDHKPPASPPSRRSYF